MPSLDTTIPVGSDDGHDSIKSCTGYNHTSGKYDCFTMKSLALPGLHQLMAMDGNSSAAYTADNEPYTVAGDIALGRQIDTRFSDYPLSPLNRVLVNHALVLSGLSGKPVSLITGLPVDQFYQNGRPNEQLIAEKTANLMKPVESHNSKFKPVEIKSNTVISEGIAAFYDALIQGDGSINIEIEQLIRRRPVTVVDLGGKTLDIATVSEGVSGVYKDRSGTDLIGVIGLKGKVAELVKARFKLNNEPPSKYIDEAFLSKQYELFGKMEDVSEIIETCSREYVAEVRNAFLKKVGDGSDLGAVIFVGGGTALIKLALGDSILETIYRGRIISPESPEFANARGMWKAAKYIFKDTHAEKDSQEIGVAA